MPAFFCSILLAVAASDAATSVRVQSSRSAALAGIATAASSRPRTLAPPPSARRLIDGYAPHGEHVADARTADHERAPLSSEFPLALTASGMALGPTGLTVFVHARRTGRTHPVRATVSRRGVRLIIPF